MASRVVACGPSPLDRRTTVRRLQLAVIAMFIATACGGGSSSTAATPTSGGSASGGQTSGQEESGGDSTAAGQFQLNDSDTADQAHGDHPSEIEATRTEAAMRLFVVDRDSGPIEGVVIKLTSADGSAYYTGETDSAGYGEVLVPVGQRYRDRVSEPRSPEHLGERGGARGAEPGHPPHHALSALASASAGAESRSRRRRRRPSPRRRPSASCSTASSSGAGAPRFKKSPSRVSTASSST